MDFGKYDPLKYAKQEYQDDVQGTGMDKPCLTTWKNSAPVIRLSEYLKKHRDKGMKLYQSDGCPVLIFDPGISCNELKSERGNIAMNATSLLLEAADDLKYLIINNLIDIPMHPRSASAGPSGALGMQGSRQHDLSLHLK